MFLFKARDIAVKFMDALGICESLPLYADFVTFAGEALVFWEVKLDSGMSYRGDWVVYLEADTKLTLLFGHMWIESLSDIFHDAFRWNIVDHLLILNWLRAWVLLRMLGNKIQTLFGLTGEVRFFLELKFFVFAFWRLFKAFDIPFVLLFQN